MATLLETHSIPPTTAVGGGSSNNNNQTLNLTYFDMFWIHFYPMRRILFYNHPCSKPEFLNDVVPKLKQSLSLALKHYLPVAGNLLYPNNTADKKPVIRYTAGDHIKLIVAESSRDFDELTVYHARDSDQFYDFMPEIPSVRDDGECKLTPLVALQATLLPGRGICIGIAHLHCLADGRSFNSGFASAWASICKHGVEDNEILAKSLPSFDRSIIEDPMKIESIFWEQMKLLPFGFSLKPIPLPTNRVRATYTFRRSDIKKLKKRVLTTKPDLIKISSFVTTVTYMWSCMAKCGSDGFLQEQLSVAIDATGRLAGADGVPVPANYFGNCVTLAVTVIEHEKLVGEGGYEAAAAAVAEGIRLKVENTAEMVKGAENWLVDLQKCQGGGVRVCGVAGSPKFDLSEVDFGWGKAAKMENLTLDGEKFSMSLCNSKEEGGLEYGVSLTREKMEAFASIFARGLSS